MSNKPQVRVTAKLVRNMTPDEYNQCMRMGYKDGCIRSDLARTAMRYPHGGSQVVLARVGNRIRSWALVDRTGFSLDKLPMVQLWTQRRWRRHGLGRKVIQKVKQITDDHFDFYRDQAPDFFDNVGARRPINPMFATY